MSLFLGKLGRPLLGVVASNRYAGAVAIAGTKLLGAVLPVVTSGLTVETYRLWDNLSSRGLLTNTTMPSEIQVKEDGFYLGERKLAGNRSVAEAFRKAGKTRINTEEIVGPEYLANIPRQRAFTWTQFLLINLLPAAVMGGFAQAAIESDPIYLIGAGSAFLFTSTFRQIIEKGYNLWESFQDGDNRLRWPRPTFLEIEHSNPAIERFYDVDGSVDGYYASLLPCKVFVNHADLRYDLRIEDSIYAFHEKAHLLGASEREAWFFHNVFLLKRGLSSGCMEDTLKALYVGFWAPLLYTYRLFLYSFAAMNNFFDYEQPYSLQSQRGESRKLIQALKSAKLGLRKVAREMEELSGRKDARAQKRLLHLIDIENKWGSNLVQLYQVLGAPRQAFPVLVRMAESLKRALAITDPLKQKHDEYRQGLILILLTRANLLNDLGAYREMEEVLKEIRRLQEKVVRPGDGVLNIEIYRLENASWEERRALTA